jgi:hypothetical protein
LESQSNRPAGKSAWPALVVCLLYRLGGVADSTVCRLTSDAVDANGVTIAAGASFAVPAGGNPTLTDGTVFTVIKNNAATPIAGTFANLADGAILTIGTNKLQADYLGGDGNDLTLTVVQ